MFGLEISIFTASNYVPTELLVFSNWNSVILLADFNHFLWQNLSNKITTGYGYLFVQIKVYLNTQKSIRSSSVEDLLRLYGPTPSQSTTKSDQLLCSYFQSSFDNLKGWRFYCGTIQPPPLLNHSHYEGFSYVQLKKLSPQIRD